jgi:pyrimidine operon attenuation protein/uracil phosphoribosyltransferase
MAVGQLKTTVMDADAIRRSLTRIAHEIVESNRGVDGVVVVGIMNKGAPLARRLGTLLTKMERSIVPVGAIDPSAHRDDLHLQPARAKPGEPELPPIDGQTVVLVDDVIWHGRTVRAAIDALLEHGRPRAVQLAVLIDRGHRELPIRPDYVGKNVPTAQSERVHVLLNEIDGLDSAVIVE